MSTICGNAIIIPSAEGGTVVSVQDTKAVTITSNGTVSVTPDTPYDALKKVDVPVPVASGAPHVSSNTVEPNRYSVDLDNRTFQLDLTGLVAGSHYICYLDFQGEALDSDNMNTTGDTIPYALCVFDIGNDQFGITYSFQDGAGYAPIEYNSPLVLNLNILLETTRNDYGYGMAYNITAVLNSVIVSWD